MIKYIKNDGCSIIKFNTENLDTSLIANISTNINWIWILDEDGTLDDEQVNAGDVLIRFYAVSHKDKPSKKEYVLIKDERLKDYYKRLMEIKKELFEESVKEPCNSCNCEAAH